MSAADGRPRYRVHAGFRMPLGFPIAGFESGQRYAATSHDVFVASYPKCGTTWTQYIVYLLHHDAEPLAADRSLGEVFPHLEEVGRDVVAALPAPRLIKTHLPFGRTPWHEGAKYVYVARNPFDCAVSFYHHTRGFVRHYDFAAGTWETFFECFLAGEVDFGDYFDNLLSWWAQRQAGNVLWLTYEELLADPAAAVVALGRFLGGRAAQLVRDAGGVERVVRSSSFEEMRREQGRWSSPRPSEMPPFVRRGIVGDAASYFSAEQTARLMAKLRARTVGTGVDALWPWLEKTMAR